MTREQLQQIRAIVYDAYCEGDTEAEWMLVVIDAARAAPEQEPVAWQERQIIGWKDDTYKWSDWYSCKYNTEQVVKARARTTQYEWRPLYTRPMPEPAAPEQEPVANRPSEAERRSLVTECGLEWDEGSETSSNDPFAWATFDGEGSYDLRLYECNEDYRAEYIKRNGDKYSGWVIPLYTAPGATQ